MDKKNRRVEMNYHNNRGYIHVAIDPPIGSQGIPAATPAERFAADDTVTYKISSIKAVIKLDEMTIKKPGKVAEVLAD